MAWWTKLFDYQMRDQNQDDATGRSESPIKEKIPPFRFDDISFHSALALWRHLLSPCTCTSPSSPFTLHLRPDVIFFHSALALWHFWRPFQVPRLFGTPTLRGRRVLHSAVPASSSTAPQTTAPRKDTSTACRIGKSSLAKAAPGGPISRCPEICSGSSTASELFDPCRPS